MAAFQIFNQETSENSWMEDYFQIKGGAELKYRLPHQNLKMKGWKV